jgi:hypothetical protein
MKKYILSATIILILTAVILLYSFRTEIYKSFTVNVKTTWVGGPILIDGKMYEKSVQSKYIHTREDGGSYIILLKRRGTFWYASNYCYFADVNILSDNDMYSALEILDDYKTGDEIIIFYDGKLTHGQDVYVAKD